MLISPLRYLFVNFLVLQSEFTAQESTLSSLGLRPSLPVVVYRLNRLPNRPSRSPNSRSPKSDTGLVLLESPQLTSCHREASGSSLLRQTSLRTFACIDPSFPSSLSVSTLRSPAQFYFRLLACHRTERFPVIPRSHMECA